VLQFVFPAMVDMVPDGVAQHLHQVADVQPLNNFFSHKSTGTALVPVQHQLEMVAQLDRRVRFGVALET